MSPAPAFVPRALALLAAAALCAALANALARPDRKLAWTGRVPVSAPAAPAGPALAAIPAPAAPEAAAPPKAPVPPPAARPPRPSPQERFPPSPAGTTRELSSQDAWAAFGLGIPFLDARRTADYADGHVAGAWSAPVWEADCDRRITEFEARANPAPKDPIVLYCSGSGCEDSRLLAGKLQALGYRNLLLYTDGFPDWAARSRPVEKGVRR